MAIFQYCVLLVGVGGGPFSSWILDLGTRDLKKRQEAGERERGREGGREGRRERERETGYLGITPPPTTINDQKSEKKSRKQLSA